VGDALVHAEFDALGIDGVVQDLVTSADGKRAAVVLDGRRALVFELQ